MQGFGTFTLPDGKYYKGNYENDKKKGYGEFFWPGKFIVPTKLCGPIIIRPTLSPTPPPRNLTIFIDGKIYKGNGRIENKVVRDN